MYNLLSLGLGFLALGMALYSLKRQNRPVCTVVSGSCCNLSLLCQLLELKRLARMEDVAALLDTASARALAGVVLVGSLLAIQSISVRNRRKGER